MLEVRRAAGAFSGRLMTGPVSTEGSRRRERWAGWSLPILGLVVLASRLPWIGAGYGADPDAARVVLAARSIAATGRYGVSRFPGYPVYEYLVALTPAGTSPPVSNGLTALASVAATLFFVLILRHFRVRHAALLGLGFAMTPVVYINSTCTMDYLFSLAFVLAATWLVLTDRTVLAGVALGVAVGCRITAGAMLVPLSLWIVLRFREEPREVVRRVVLFGAVTLALAALCFAPVIARYGPRFLRFYDITSYPSLAVVLRRGVWSVWGRVGGTALLAVLVSAPLLVGPIRRALGRREVRGGLALSGTAVLLYMAAFLRLPQEPGYLIPVVPFLLLGLALVLPHRLTVVLAVALVLSPFVAVGPHGLSWSGPIVHDHQIRQAHRRETRGIIERVERLPGRAVVIAGWYLPRLRLALGGTTQGPHRYVYLIRDREAFRRLVTEGRTVYFLPEMADYCLRARGFDPRQLGARPLP